ncbi:hypothetical protein CDAR_99271 [Caerostris darwini]|uniref:Uncharacterized protein n=1 Tax=Caerostris darwini TaxID=1538125 RepID=A0AAV4Q427_9ARAC|nr:hypothetical protein CDAR_99271 [Caerostris darwini]
MSSEPPTRIKPTEIGSQIPSFAVDGQHGISYKLAFVTVSTFALDADRILEITIWFWSMSDCSVMIPAALLSMENPGVLLWHCKLTFSADVGQFTIEYFERISIHS